jgi:hypothetical protein
MASTALPVEVRPGILAPALPFLVAAAIYGLLLLLGNALLNDADTWWHIASGNWILANGFPHADPFSFTFAGRPWIAKEWLSQIAYALAFRLGGWAGVVALAAASFALACGLLAHALRERLAPLPTLALVAVAFMLAAPHATARPHVLAFPVMVAWVAGLAGAAEGGRRPPYALLLLMVLWANLHAGFTFGILLVAAFGLDAVAAASVQERRRTALAWLRFGALTLVAGSITPYGPQSMFETVKVLGLGPALSIIGEWKPADFAHPGPLELTLVIGLGLALWRGVMLPWPRVLTLLGLVHMALSADRNAELLGLVAPLVLAAPLARQFPELRVTPAPANSRFPRESGDPGDEGQPATGSTLASPAAGLLLAALAFPLTAGLATIAPYQPNPANAPAAALAAVRAASAGPILNDYNFGGYLIASGVPTFIDGRTELYGRDFTLAYFGAVTLADADGLSKLLDKYGIGATLLTPGTPAIAVLDRDPAWKRVYADDTAIAHIRVPLRGTLN